MKYALSVHWGAYLQELCHQNLAPLFKQFQDFEYNDQIVFKMRANIMVSDQSIKTICCYHELKFGESFPKQNSKCCNIFGKHNKDKKKKAAGLITIMLEAAILL